MKRDDEEYKPGEEFAGDTFQGDSPEEVTASESAYEEESPFADLGPTGPQPPAFVRLLTDRRVLMPIFLVIIIYLVYKYFISDFGVSTQETTKKATVVQKPLVVQQPVSAVRQQALQSQLSTAAVASEQNKKELSAITSSLQTLQNEQMRLGTQLNQLNSSLGGLSTIVEKLVKQQAEMGKPKVVKQKVVKKKVQRVVYRPPYDIQAIVPGRAWIETPDGRTITIRTGEKLRGYGVVTVIDAELGIIKTTSGYSITYGRLDS